jgi:hypothetical protein
MTTCKRCNRDCEKEAKELLQDCIARCSAKKVNINAWQCDLGIMSVLRVPQGCYKLLIFDPKTKSTLSVERCSSNVLGDATQY